MSGIGNISLSGTVDGRDIAAGNIALFLASDPAVFQFRTDLIVQAQINALAAREPTMAAGVMGSYRVSYEFDPAQAYFEAGSPAVIPAVIPLPPAWAMFIAAAALLVGARRRSPAVHRPASPGALTA